MLLKPLTYMNLSGQSIAPAANFYKIPADHVIVLCDDITQEPGHLRIRPHGSAGGHNGLKSIIASLGTENFARIRIGIGAKPNPQYDLAAWVLGKLPPADRKAMTDRYPDIEDACRLLMDGNLQYARTSSTTEGCVTMSDLRKKAMTRLVLCAVALVASIIFSVLLLTGNLDGQTGSGDATPATSDTTSAAAGRG
mgnify:CR=1 FL=1